MSAATPSPNVPCPDVPSPDVLVIGGGNAALCAALTAREAGASVLLLEAAPRVWRGGNSMHVRNLRCMHDAPQDVLIEAYGEEDIGAILRRSPPVARTSGWRGWPSVIPPTAGAGWPDRACTSNPPYPALCMWHGPTLSSWVAARPWSTPIIAAPGRKASRVRYETPVERLELDGDRFVAAVTASGERIEARTCVLGSGGFESNLAWQREAWGQNERGEWPAENFLVRGTRFNQGTLLKFMIEAGADVIGDPTQAHCVAIDARAPLYDGGICTRIDCVSLGVVVDRDAKRFYDEGEDFWPKRYAIWGRLVAHRPGQIAWSIIDRKAVGRFMPPVFEGTRADSLDGLAQAIGLDPVAFVETLSAYNAACRPGAFDHTLLDDCHTEGLVPAKTHWARPIDSPPFFAYPLRPGITFTYLGLKTDETAAVRFAGRPCPNLFVAGEMMAGNVLGQGYMAGIGMSIGTAFGRIAGASAARAVGRANQDFEEELAFATAL